MKDKQSFFVYTPGDTRLKSVCFGITIRLYMTRSDEDLWAACALLRDLMSTANDNLTKLFEDYTTEKLFWTVKNPSPHVIQPIQYDGKSWDEIKQSLNFVLTIPTQLIGNDASIVEMSNVLVAIYDKLFHWVKIVNETLSRSSKFHEKLIKNEITYIDCALRQVSYTTNDGVSHQTLDGATIMSEINKTFNTEK